MPEEMRALLLTDIVGSTDLTRTLGDAGAAALWAAHDRAARDLLPRWNGREIDKSDGLLLLFDRVDQALGYARDYLQALGRLPVPLLARAGLHHGPVLLRANPPEDVARGAKPLEVDGLAKPIAARVMALAGGQQLLLTEAARDALGDTPPPGWHWHAHGHWALAGLGEPVALFEALPDEQTTAAPAARPLADGEKGWRVVRHADGWRPVREVPHNLPQQSTGFVGRELEQARLQAMLRQHRLVTLWGMGGLGKTRLSLQVAAALRPEFPDGTWFIDYSGIRDPDLVASEALRRLGQRDEPGQSAQAQLLAHLAGRRVLLVLDNAEQLVQAVAALVHALLTAAPGLRVLVTSREALRVPGEQLFAVHPLPLPGAGAGLDAAAASAAVRLFVERAAGHRPGFALTADNLQAVTDLVVRLEGIPLALELAAARVRLLSVADIGARLRDRFRLLTGGARVHDARQQTLLALVDWSYELLSTDERTLFDRLGVFVGGFDLEAVEQVCAEAPLDPFDVMDLLGSLVDKSLVLADEVDDGAAEGAGRRYRLLETLRDYALVHQNAAGTRLDLARRHCEHYVALAKRINTGRQTAEQAAWLQRADQEADNLRAAMALPLSGEIDPVLAVKLAMAMLGTWLMRGRAAEGRLAVRAALARPEVQAMPMAQAFALYVDAALAGAQGELGQALVQLETCLALRRGLDRPVDVAATLSTLALTRLQSGDTAGALRDEAEALGLFRAAGDRVGEAISLLHLGQIALHEARHDEAGRQLQQALAAARAIGHREVEAEARLSLGISDWQAAGALADGAAAAREQALAHVQAACELCAEAGDTRGEAMARWWRARLVLQALDPATDLVPLAQSLDRALKDFEQYEMRAEMLGALEDAAALAAWAGDRQAQGAGAVDEAVRWVAAAEAGRQRASAPRTPAEQAWWQARRAPWQAQMGEAAFEQAARQGQAMELRAAVREARERLAAITALTPPTAAPVPGAAQARVALAT